MPYPVSIQQQQKLKQSQRLIMSPQMQQAIHLLQMPILEMAQAIELELEQNPVLEYLNEEEDETTTPEQVEETPEEQEVSFDDQDFEILKRLDEDFRDLFAESGNYYNQQTAEEAKKKVFLDSSICKPPTLFEHLMAQAHETFPSPEDRKMSESIIGNFDESGFFQTPLEEIAVLQNCDLKRLQEVLHEIQMFEPIGVGARTLQECFLIQLRHQKKEKSLAYEVIDKHYDDLLHNRIPLIKKSLKCSQEEIIQAIDSDIAKLDLHPGTTHSHQIVQQIVPDVTLRQEGDQLVTYVDDDFIPSLRLNGRYLRMMDDETIGEETKTFIKKKILSAKWLVRNISQRNDTIQRIVDYLGKKQRKFFLDPKGKLVPLNMKTVADALEIHESTVARAVANKYLNSPRGVLPLRYFFTPSYKTAEGDLISSRTVRDALQKIIHNEDKLKPLSDEKLSNFLKKKGIDCARRTIAKYRAELNIGNAQQRRKF